MDLEQYAKGLEWRVPVSRSREMFHLLNEGGKSVEFLEFESAGHSVTNPRVIGSIEAFPDERLRHNAGTP